MAYVVLFDEFTNRVLRHIGSADTTQYLFRPDAIVNPGLLFPAGLPIRYQKRVANTVEEMSESEKSAVDAEIASALDAATRAEAKSGLAGQVPMPLLLRAFADVIRSEINVLRSQHGLSDRTLSQLRSAIEARIDGGSVDE